MGRGYSMAFGDIFSSSYPALPLAWSPLRFLEKICRKCITAQRNFRKKCKKCITNPDFNSEKNCRFCITPHRVFETFVSIIRRGVYMGKKHHL